MLGHIPISKIMTWENYNIEHKLDIHYLIYFLSKILTDVFIRYLPVSVGLKTMLIFFF